MRAYVLFVILLASCLTVPQISRIAVGSAASADRTQTGIRGATSSGEWTLRGTQPPGRDGHGFVYDSMAGLFILFGGAITATGFTNSTWSYEYGTNTWTNITPRVGPSPRAGAGIVYDSRADRVIVYGGSISNFGVARDTWVFDYTNDTWTNVTSASGPGPRSLSNMVYGSAADRTILFGGAGMFGPLGDTWSYDYETNAWTMLTANSPGALFAPSMAYDSTADRVVLFGGAIFSGPNIIWKNDTWALSVADQTWTNTHASTSPAGRGGAPMVYDSQSDVALVFGGANTFGSTPSGYFNDTWAYNATKNGWTDISPVHSPSPRVLSALAYDPVADRAVLFGGASASGIPYADAWAFQYIPPAPSYPPSEPKSLTASGGNGQVVLTWEAPSSNGTAPVTNYEIYRGTTTGGESHLTTVGDVRTYTDGAVTNGQVYYYEVAAVSSAGEGPRSNEASATPQSVPSAPRSLAAVPGDGRVMLNWQTPASNGGSAITTYSVYRGTSAGTETLLAILGTVLSYEDSGLTNGQPYYYRVSANNSVGEGPLSNEISVMPATVPSAPNSLAATAASGEITLTWSAPTSNGGTSITGYNMYRGTSTGTELLLKNVGVVLAYTDAGLANGQTYYYEVAAVNAVGEGPKSKEATATPTASATPPSAPQDIQATPGHSQVTLTWTAPVSTGGSAVTGYKLYRGLTSGTETLVASLGSALLTYTDSGLTNGQTYYYQVSAVNDVGEGPKSNEVYATPPTPVLDSVPPVVEITSPANNSALTATSVTVTGTASDNVAVEKVEISLDGTTWTVASGTASWSASVSLQPGANTIYVRATDRSGNQATTRITVTVQPVQPSGLPLAAPVLAGIGLAIIVVVAAAAAVVLRRRRRGRLPPSR